MKYYTFTVRRGDVPAWYDMILPYIKDEYRCFPNHSTHAAEVLRGAPDGVTLRVLEYGDAGDEPDLGKFFRPGDEIIKTVEVTVYVPESQEDFARLPKHPCRRKEVG